MFHFVKLIEKISKNWKGEIEFGECTDFDIALNTQNGSGILNTSSKKLCCPKCSKELKYLITSKTERKSKGHVSIPKKSDFNDFSTQNQEIFFETILNLTKQNCLKITVCCLLITADKNHVGNEFACITLGNNVPNLKIQNRKKICSLVGITSEKLVKSAKKFDFEKCECEIKCNLLGGTSSFNDFGKKISSLGHGINLVAFDLDQDLDNLIGFQTLCNNFLVFLNQNGTNNYWVMFSLPVKEKTNKEIYYHTVACQVLLTKRPHALLIDPNEANSYKNKQRGYWLTDKIGSKSGKEKIKDALGKFLQVKTITFGSNGNGKAKPEECFAQYRDACNVTVILTFFWLSIGYYQIPRFDRVTERAIFCRLRRLSTTLPKNLSVPIKRKLLKSAVSEFISK